MAVSSSRLGRRWNNLGWLIWGGMVLAWSASLLTPQPVVAAHQVLPQEMIFLLGKTLHVFAYMILTMLSSWLRMSEKLRWGITAFLFLHAVGTEYLQLLVPMRTGAPRDVGLNFLGIVLGLVLSWKWWRVRPCEMDVRL